LRPIVDYRPDLPARDLHSIAIRTTGPVDAGLLLPLARARCGGAGFRDPELIMCDSGHSPAGPRMRDYGGVWRPGLLGAIGPRLLIES